MQTDAPRSDRPFDLSAIALLAANALPLIGVLFWGWDAARIVFLYWFENVVVGLINVLKISTAAGPVEISKKALAKLDPEIDPSKVVNASKLFMVPFFIVHYGLFTFVHGAFLVAFFSPDGFFGGHGDHFGDVGELFHRLLSGGGGWAALALVASHLYSFGTNYIGRGEYLRTSPQKALFLPYGRVVVLHIAIILGGIAVQALENPTGLLVLLVVGKTILDLVLHWKSHAARAAEA